MLLTTAVADGCGGGGGKHWNVCEGESDHFHKAVTMGCWRRWRLDRYSQREHLGLSTTFFLLSLILIPWKETNFAATNNLLLTTAVARREYFAESVNE